MTKTVLSLCDETFTVRILCAHSIRTVKLQTSTSWYELLLWSVCYTMFGKWKLMYISQIGKRLKVRLNQHNDACRWSHANNVIYKHVRDTKHVIYWKAAKLLFKSKVESSRITVESALIRRTPNFTIILSTLGVHQFSSELILKSKPVILTKSSNYFPWLALKVICFWLIFIFSFSELYNIFFSA